MTVPLITSGGVFTRLGHLIGASVANLSSANDVLYYSGTTMTAKVVQIQTDFAASVASPKTVEGIQAALTNFQNAQGTFLKQMAAFCSQVVIDMVNLDQNIKSPSTLTLAQSIGILITQMGSATATVQASVPAAAAQTNVGTPIGNPVIVASVKGTNGVNQEYMFAETLTFTVTSDSQVSSGLLNAEPFKVTGIPIGLGNGATLLYTWPNGSGVNVSSNFADATANDTSGNILNNSDFETWTSGSSAPPDGWTVVVGVAGTDITRQTSPYTGTYALGFVGDAATLSSLAQTFGTGTGGTLSPSTVYAVNLVTKVSAVPAAGVLKIDLCDGSNTTINDAAGTANSVTIALTSETTTFAAHNGFFRTPAVLPAVQKLRVALTTALSNAKTAYIDHLCLTPAKQLYAGGPYVAGFSMSTPVISNDAWTIAVTNTYGKFQQAFERLFGMRSLGLQLPSAGSPSVSDSIIS